MVDAGIIASVIIAVAAIISGAIAAARLFYRRGEEAERARESRARFASDFADLKNRDANRSDGGVAYERRERAKALIILAAVGAGWLVALWRWWHPAA